MAKATPGKGIRLSGADEALLGMIAGADGGMIVVGGRHIPKAVIPRVAQNPAYLEPGPTGRSRRARGAPITAAGRPHDPPADRPEFGAPHRVERTIRVGKRRGSAPPPPPPRPATGQGRGCAARRSRIAATFSGSRSRAVVGPVGPGSWARSER